MNSSVLCPPNHHLLSDNVISATTKQSKRGHAVFTNQNETAFANRGFARAETGGYSSPTALCADTTNATTANPWGGKNYNSAVLYYSTHGIDAVPAASAPAAKRKRETSRIEGSPKRRQTAGATAPPNLAAVKADVDQERVAELIRLGQDIHRKRCRESQRRYRKKQNGRLIDLETTTVQLRVEVARLEEKRNDLSAAVQKKANMWNVAVEYLWLFRHGLQLQRQPAQDAADAQLDFMQKAIATDVACNDGFGQTAAIRSWWFLQWFGDVEIELRGLEKISNTSLSTVTSTTVTITKQTLQKLFPHLSSDVEGDWARKFACKLIGQRISMRGSVYFEFDEHSGHVMSIIAQSDMLTPMLRLLGNLTNVTLAFDNALISPNFQWKRRAITATP